jgi:hypothetical protein
MKRNAPRKSRSLLIIYLTFFLVCTIPIVTWGAVSGSFNLVNNAFEDITVSDNNPCVISLPNVNPYTLEIGKTITIQVDATLKDAAIASLNISDSAGNNIYQQTFSNAPLTIATSFQFTPTQSGTVDMLGYVSKVGGGSVACVISSAYDVLGLKVSPSSNQAPTFTSSPAQLSSPSESIKTGVDYSYTLTAADADGDNINYSYSFTTNNNWLKASVVQDGSSGKLSIKFQGSTDKPGSYLANVFIHDGYSDHLSAQAWVISVSPATNDIPVIKIINPITSTKVNKGETFKVNWEASDLNLITSYELYISQNPTDETSWITINKDISSSTNSYVIDTSTLDPGTYSVIVKANDNQSPSLSGLGVSPEITISGTSSTPSVTPVIASPQVTNMSPTSSDDVTNKQVTVKATLIAGTNAKIDDKTISVKLDDTDITNSVSINKISDQEHTVIYQPNNDLTNGIHKVEITFTDSNNKSVDKAWTFTINASQTENTGYYNILGLQISQRTLIIIGVGLLVVILAVVAPIIIFNVWKDDQNKDMSEKQVIPDLPSEPIPTTSENQFSEVPNLVEPPITVSQEEEPEEDVWNNFSAPTPTEAESTPMVEPAPIESPMDISKESTPQEPLEQINTEQTVTEIPQPEVNPVNLSTTSEPVQEGIPESSEVQNTTPSTASMDAPEPDLSADIDGSDDLISIYDQIKQQEETPQESPKE